MKKREVELKAEIARMLAAAEAADAEEDATFGKDKRGDEMPDWAGDKQKRLAKIQQAMAALEAEAKLAAEEERRIEAEKEQQRQAEGRKKPGKPAAPPSEEPNPKAQRNFTDPESRIMKSKDGFVQAYNAQAAVDAGAQIIVAHELTQCGNDLGNRSDAGAHQADTVEIGLLAGALLGAFARLIALVQQLDFLEFLESLGQHALGVFKLNAQFVGGPGQVFPALDRGLGIGRIGEMRGIVDPGALLLGVNFALQIDRHTLEVGDHTFDLGDPSALLVDLKLLQAD